MNFIFLCLHGCHLAISIDLIRFNKKVFYFKVNSDLLKKKYFSYSSFIVLNIFC